MYSYDNESRHRLAAPLEAHDIVGYPANHIVDRVCSTLNWISPQSRLRVLQYDNIERCRAHQLNGFIKNGSVLFDCKAPGTFRATPTATHVLILPYHSIALPVGKNGGQCRCVVS